MDFGLDENQQAVADLTAEVVRKEAAGPDPAECASADFDEPLWAALAKVGLLGIAVPSALGGDGLGIAEVAVVLTELGRRAARVPALAMLALGVLPIAAHGTDPQRAALLPDCAAGNAVLTGAVDEPGDALAAAPRTRARQDGGGWILDGVKVAVPYAAQAARVLVPATTPDGRRGVFLVDPSAEGVTLTRTPSATGAPEYGLRLDGVVVEVTALLGDDLTGAAADTLADLAVAGAVAFGDGALAGALTLTTEHVRTRRQFGVPLATFQAVAQQIADVYIASRTVHLAASSAAWQLGAGRDARGELDLAAYWFAAEALPALRTCHHLHGGLGVDVTYPLHAHYSAVKDLVRFLGGAGSRQEALGASVGS